MPNELPIPPPHQPDQERKLAAILFADIANYTALMQWDEVQARQALQQFRDVLIEQIGVNRGRVVNFYGDGCLSIFDSAVNAVQCAKEAQRIFQTEPKVPVRMGLHSGDVFFEAHNAYGDSVNIASRIESLGVVGSVLFSKSIKRHIANQQDFRFRSVGPFEFKNVKKKMEVFALANEGLVIPNRKRLLRKIKVSEGVGLGMPYNKWIWTLGILSFLFIGGFFWYKYSQFLIRQNAPDPGWEKSIAVLPFENLNASSDQLYLSDGISQDILTHLSGIKDLQVISFNSSKQFRNSDAPSKEIGEALGVRHLLSGSVQQSGDQIRIRTTLIDSDTDQQLWGKKFDGRLEDIFQIQSQVSQEIAQLLKAKLLPGVAERINSQPTRNMEAWQEYAQGRHLWEQRGQENLWAAEKRFQKAIELDPGFGLAYAGLAQTYSIIGIDDKPYLQKSKTFAEKAIELNPSAADAYSALGEYYYRSSSDYARAIPNFEKALELEPGNATAYQWFAELLISKGEITQGRAMIDAAQKLDPGSRIIKLMSALFLMCEDQYEKAGKSLETFYRESPQVDPVSSFLTQYYAEFGAYDKAQRIPVTRKGFTQEEKDLIIYRASRDLPALRALKKRIEQMDPALLRAHFSYNIETEIYLLSGELDRYISRQDSTIFVLGYHSPFDLQMFPPPDSIRLHPRFQEMMRKRGFTIRPRAPLLDQKK